MLPGAHGGQARPEIEPEPLITRHVEESLRAAYPGHVVRTAVFPGVGGLPDAVVVRRLQHVPHRGRVRRSARRGGYRLIDQAAEHFRGDQVVLKQVERRHQQVVDVPVRLPGAFHLAEQDVTGERHVPQFVPAGQAKDGIGGQPGQDRIIGVTRGLPPQFQNAALALVCAPRDPVTAQPIG